MKRKSKGEGTTAITDETFGRIWKWLERVHSLITFDAHDPRMQNVIPLTCLENVSPVLQFTQAFLTEYEDITVDSEHLMFIAPDEGATGRVVFLASLFGVNIGMFYKRRDYTRFLRKNGSLYSCADRYDQQGKYAE